MNEFSNNKQLIEKLLEALDQNATTDTHRHRKAHSYLVENGMSCRRLLTEGVDVSRVNIKRVIRRLVNCGLIAEKTLGHVPHYAALTPDAIDVKRVAAAYAVVVMQYTYEQTAAQYKATYGTMP